MTAPVWMAAPPEVHSGLLSSGPGPGSLLGATGAWNSLSAEYASVAAELGAVLAAVHDGAWEGPSAESYVAAHAPYLAWLMQASANSSAAAAQHEAMAAAYTAALAAMPTLAELAANHTIHGVLVGTNFFGINTIPIALNEADYVRMWIQAATTMATYQAVTSTAVASTPQTTAAPQILKSNASAQDSAASNPVQQIEQIPHQIVQQFLQNLGVNWDPANGTVNGLPYDSYTNPADPMWWVVRALELSQDFQTFGQQLLTNPAAAFQYLVELELFDWPTHIAQLTGLNPTQLLIAVAAGLAAAPAGSAAGFAGLAGLAGLPQAAVAPALAPAAPNLLPAAGMAPTVVATATAPGTAPAPAPAPTASTVASSAPPPTPPAPGGAGFVPPYAVGPGIGSGSGMSTSASAGAKKKAQEPDAAVAPAAAAARKQARARRRRRLELRGDGDETVDMNVEVDPDWDAPPGQQPVASTVVSDRGAGPLGFAGTVSKGNTQPAGLAALAGDEFGGGPRMPMVPGTWDPEAPEGEEEDG